MFLGVSGSDRTGLEVHPYGYRPPAGTGETQKQPPRPNGHPSPFGYGPQRGIYPPGWTGAEQGRRVSVSVFLVRGLVYEITKSPGEEPKRPTRLVPRRLSAYGDAVGVQGTGYCSAVEKEALVYEAAYSFYG